MKSLKITVLILIALISGVDAMARTYTAPGSREELEIEGRTVTIVGNGVFRVEELELEEGATLIISEGVTLIVTDEFENKEKSTVIVNGTLILEGNDNENDEKSVIEGSGVVFFKKRGLENKGRSTVFGSTEKYPDCTSGCSFTTLPVELLSFEATFDKNVKITWSTASEINNEYFSLERSEDGVEFYEIARIEGNGNSTEVIEYAYEDNAYKSEVEYYRLTQVDFDGQYEVFKAIRVETNMGETENSFNVFPTVVTQGKVTIEGEKPFQVKDIQVISLTGSSNVYQPATSEVGFRNVEVDVNGMENGLYLLKMVSEDGNEMTSKIIIK